MDNQNKFFSKPNNRIITVACVMLCLLTLMLFTYVSPVLAGIENNVITLDKADFVYDGSDRPPVFSNAVEVVLPHVWNGRGFYGSAWYRFSFTYQGKHETSELWAVFVPELNMNAEVWLNGSKIGSGGSMQAPITRYWHSPLYFNVPVSQLKATNTLSIRIVAYANAYGNLGQVYVGPDQLLNSAYATENLSSKIIHPVSAAIAFCFTLVLMPVWYKRRDSLFLWCALACFAWAFSSMNLFVHDIPVSERSWETLMQISIGWVPVLFAFFILRLEGKHRIMQERVVLSVGAAFNFILVLVAEDHLFPIAHAWHAFGLLVGLYGVTRLLRAWWLQRSESHLVMLLSLVVIAICGVHDMMVQTRSLGLEGRFWLDYSVPFILLIVGYLMVRRFLYAVEEAETLNRELESRVEAAQNTIEMSYQRILSLETVQAANQERERIYRDLHDDLGSKLLSMVYRSNTDEMSNLARSAMNDLREIVSQKPGVQQSLRESLNAWRAECKKQTGHSAIRLEWQENGIIDDVQLSAELVRHMERIRTEAVTNALKHSSGDSLVIRARYRCGYLKMKVTDNGEAVPMDNWGLGRGLTNMRYRVEQLGGRIHWQALNGRGVSVSWLVPLMQEKS